MAQHSVLLLGRPLMASNPSDSRIKKIPVSHGDKERLRGELAAIGIDATSLFPDLHGIATTNSVEHPVVQVSAKDLLAQGVSAYNKGDAVGARDALAAYVKKRPDDCVARLLLSNAYVDLTMYGDALRILDAAEQHLGSFPLAQHYMLYANRANTRAAMGDHEHAIADYEHALGLPGGDIEGSLRFNSGNSHFALRDFQKALDEFGACDGYALAAFNAGNTCIALGQFGNAAEKFADAQHEPRVREHSIRNLGAVREIMSLVGTDQCEVELPPATTPSSSSSLRVVVRSDHLTNGPRFIPIIGNTGNQGNIGWGAVGGQGFEGSDGMVVEVKGSADG